MLTRPSALAVGDPGVIVRAKARPAALYRPDIDGLRAIAVMAVVFYHAGFHSLSGGFLGVDIFFVISGYLIGGQVYREIEAGTFSYGAFYARRARRILPALFVLLVTLYAIGWLLMTPQEFRELGRESVGAVFGANNLLFYLGNGYFSPSAANDPLLATWSLGVEEQFYVAFPALMLLVMRWRRADALALIGLLSIASFVGSIVLLHRDPDAAFYLLPTRAWELGIGIVLALAEQRGIPRVPPRWIGELLSAVAVAMLLLAVMLYDRAIAFPGYYVLLPTVATASLIMTRTSWINRTLLAEPGMVILGKISYSWYLWHWPLFYLNHIIAGPGGGLSPAVLLVVSVLCGAASWRFVEQPFRRRILPQTVTLRLYAAAAVAVATIGLGLFVTKGIAMRLPSAARAAAIEAAAARSDACLAGYGADSFRADGPCLPPLAAGQTQRLVVLGDSHAAAIAPGFRDWAAARGMAFGEITKASCAPLPGFAPVQADRPAHWRQCLTFQDRAFAYVAAHPEAGIVVLAGYWGDDMALRAAAGGGAAPAPLATALAATIARLQALGKRVVLLQDVPTFGFDPYGRTIGAALPLRALAAGALAPRWPDRDSAPRSLVQPDGARPIVDAAAQTHGITLIDPMQSLCTASSCRYRDGAATFYFDFQHLTRTGAIAVLRGTPFEVPARPAGDDHVALLIAPHNGLTLPVAL